MPEIVYDDQHIRVIWSPGASGFLLVTFSDMMRIADGVRFTADKTVEKAGLSSLAFMPKSSNWYPVPSVMAGVQAAAGRIERYRERVIYGCSMGGYGALKFSAALQATHVIALCPQWSLDPAEVTQVDRRYAMHFKPNLSGMGIRAADVSGRGFVLRDPEMRLDQRHCINLRANWPEVMMVDTHSCGHRLTAIFAGTENLLALIETARSGSLGAMQALANRIRRAHYLRGVAVLAHASGRHPLAASRILRHRFASEPRYAALGARLLPLLCERLEASGHPEEAAAYKTIFEGVDRPRDATADMMEDLSPES